MCYYKKHTKSKIMMVYLRTILPVLLLVKPNNSNRIINYNPRAGKNYYYCDYIIHTYHTTGGKIEDATSTKKKL